MFRLSQTTSSGCRSFLHSILMDRRRIKSGFFSVRAYTSPPAANTRILPEVSCIRLEIVTAAIAAVVLSLRVAGVAEPVMFVTLSEGGDSFLTLPDNGTGRIQFSNLSYFGYELSGLACDSNFCGGTGSSVPKVELLDFSAVCGPGGFQGHPCPEITVAYGETVDTGLSNTPGDDVHSHIQGGWAVSTVIVHFLMFGGQTQLGGAVTGLIPFHGFFGGLQLFPAGIGGSTSNNFTFDLGPQPFGFVSTPTSDVVYSQGAEISFAAASDGDQGEPTECPYRDIRPIRYRQSHSHARA